jgi:tetratricopeptide (TPR) repeat protein
MPTTTYMQRSPRHDHGWLRPDPLLTKELGIPNACNRCHTDRSADWAMAKTDAWFGAKMDSRQRARARAVAAAQAGQPEAAAALLKLLADEDIPAWRATLLTLLAPAVGEPAVRAQARASLQAADPLERSAAVRLLAGTPGAPALLRPLLHDPVRLVRLDAEWSLSAELRADSPERKELDAYLSLTLDQPSGRLRLGQDLVNRGQLTAGEREMARAESWDPNSPGIRLSHAQVLAAQGRPAEAGDEFMQAAKLSPGDAIAPMQAALAYAEAGRLADAETAFRLAVQRNPRFDRAWYNLGLLLAQTGRRDEAADALKRAMSLAPRVPDYPYALATVLLQTGDAAGARAAARRALELAPDHAGARQIMAATR